MPPEYTSLTPVRIAPDGRLLINNHPSFFIGFSPGPPIGLETPEGGDGWAELAEGGIRVVREGAPPRENWSCQSMDHFEKILDCAHAHGVFVWPNLRELVRLDQPGRRKQLAAFIKRFRGHPAVLFWKSADEPEWGKVPVKALREAYELIRELDPDHPVWIAHAPRGTLETLRPYNDACDVLAIDIYPVSEPPGKHSLEVNKGLSMVGDLTRRVVNLAGGRKMVFMILQACWSGVMPSHNPKNRLMFPTFRQERYMMYQAIICGADSLSFFGMPLELAGRDAELGWNWTYWRAILQPLFQEIRPGSELYPVLTAPNSDYPLRFTGAPRIEARWKEASVYLYIFAAAREGATRKVRFSGVEDGEVVVLHEGRTLRAERGSFTDTFAEHDVHIYRACKKRPKVE
ncbi:MAG: hypothetical protein NTW86_30020 [Candidatus Sumerlaeota bacterium]|nr:hypothetical protein [Candidatus Sumerlaeota bacterium]